MKLGEILKSYRIEHNLSMDAFCELSNLTKGYISMLEKNEHPKSKKPIVPSYDTVEKVAKGMNISVDSLIDMFDDEQEIQINATPSALSKSEIQKIYDKLYEPRQKKVATFAKNELEEQLAEQKNENLEIREEAAEYHSEKVIDFPQVYDYDFYDSATSAGTGQYLGEVQKETISLPMNVDADFVIPVYGRSMEPEYYTGDYVFVKLSVDLKDGDIGVFDYYGDAYIKQLVIDVDGAYLHSFNPEYPDMPIDADSDFRIIGEVVDVYR